jgi:hypothetical protein
LSKLAEFQDERSPRVEPAAEHIPGRTEGSASCSRSLRVSDVPSQRCCPPP